MPCFLNSNLIPSLECQSLMKAVVLLWENNRDASSLTDFCFKSKTCQGRHKEWQRTENKILLKASTLCLPELLHKKLTCSIRLIGIEILRWKESQISKVTYSREFLRASIVHLCWTSYGTVDITQTSRRVVYDDSLDVCMRYDMACMNCLEEDIPNIWKKLSEAQKKSYTGVEYCRLGKEEWIESLIKYWTRTVTGDLDGTEKSTKNIFEFIKGVQTGNKAAVEYFWPKMKDKVQKPLFSIPMGILYGKNRSFYKMISSECCFNRMLYDSDIACFLLSRNPEEKLKGVIEKGHSLIFLRFLLDWPHQSSFFEIFEHVWETITLTDFEHIARYIFHKITYGYMDCDYPELFRELWRNCPASYRKSFIRRYTLRKLLPPPSLRSGIG